VGEEVLAADFNAMVQQQVVATFANAAARTSALPSPQAGMLTYLADVKAYQWWNGAAWQPVQGVLAYAETGTAQSGITTAITDLTGLSTPSITLPASHRIEIAAEVGFTKAAPDSNSWVELHIADGSNSTLQVRFASCPAPGWAAIHASRVITLAAGSYSFKARAATGAGFVNTQTGPNSPGWIRVTDMGSV
jgi:hypothetical protein